MTAVSEQGTADVWRTWTAEDDEPAGVTVVRESSGVVSYMDSPEWKRSAGDGLWWGWKGGLKVGLAWSALLDRHGPVTGKVRAVAPVEPELVEPAPPPVPAGSWPWWTSGVAS